MDVPFLGEHFLVLCCFRVIATEMEGLKFCFGESDPLVEKFQKFTMKRFMCTVIHVFLPSFMEICKVEVTKLVHDIHHRI